MAPITEKFFHADDSIDIARIYDEVCECDKKRTHILQEDIKSAFEASKDTFLDTEGEDKELLQYFSFICMLSLDVYVKKQIIEFMAEAESNNETSKKTVKDVILNLLKIVIVFAVLFGLVVFVIMNYTKNESEIYFGNISTWLDLPSLIFVIVPALLLLLCNGLWKDFFSGIKSVIKGERKNISEKSRFANAVSVVRYIVLFSSLIAVMLGYYAVLTYLDNKEVLGPNMMVATIPCFYAVIINLILKNKKLQATERKHCFVEFTLNKQRIKNHV